MPRKKSGVSLILFFSSFLLFCLIAVPCLPATIVVNTTADDNTVNGNCTLREAILSVNLNLAVDGCTAGDAVNDIIDLTGMSGNITLGSVLPDITKNVSIIGPGHTYLTVNANGTGRVFTINSSGSNKTVTIPGLTITGGNDVNSGGAIFISAGDTLNLSSSVISYSNAPNGGGIFNAGDVVMNGCSIENNSAQQYGGGIYTQTGTMTIVNSSIQPNTAGGYGGGIFIWNGVVNFDNSVIASSTASWGGGLSMAQGTTTIARSVIANNTASNGCGGGIYTQDGTLTVSNSNITMNTSGTPGSGWSGGGVFANMNFTLTDSTVYGNQAGGGAGVTVQGNAVVVNSTFSGNTSINGATIFNTACDSCTITITNSTIANNTGIGLTNDRYATLKNVILANNSSGNCSGAITSQGHNLDSGSTCGLSNPGDLSNTDPLLGPLDGSGTHALLPGSPAIDAGDSVGCPAKDQRGISRPQDGNGDGSSACDIGAFERLPFDLTVSEGTIGTLITLTGADFGAKKGKILVGGETAKIVKDGWTRNSVTCEIKKPLTPGIAYDVIEQRKEPKGVTPITSIGVFTMLAPEIISVEPDSGSTPDEILIRGNYFGTKKGKIYLENLVSKEQKSCKVKEWSMYDLVNGDSRIRFVVPKVSSKFPAGEYLLKVSNKVGTTTASSNFTVEP
jgi:CSLREA domain-containing protein